MTAVLAAMAAAVFYGIGAALQQRHAATAPDRSAGRPALLALLARQPGWLLGIGVEALGFAAHAVALHSGPLTVVQLVSASALVVSAGLVSRWSRQPLGPGGLVAIAAVVAGLGTFVAVAMPSGSAGPAAATARAAAAAAVSGTAAVLLAGAGLAARGGRRAALLALAAALADCYVAVVTMAFSHIAGHGLAAVATSWTTYALAGGGLCSLLLTQTAYQAARPMITLPVIAVCTPLASAIVGVGLLGERVRADGPRVATAGLAVLVAIAGLIGLARAAAARESAAPVLPGPGGAGAGPVGGHDQAGARVRGQTCRHGSIGELRSGPGSQDRAVAHWRAGQPRTRMRPSGLESLASRTAALNSGLE